MENISTTSVWKQEGWKEITVVRLARTKAEGKSLQLAILLWAIFPAILRAPKDCAVLEDLRRIDCVGLLKKPWNLKDEGMVWELIVEVPNQYDLMVRTKPENWIASQWRETYNIPQEGYGMASKTNKFIRAQFRNLANPKDEFAIVDCEDIWAKRVLEFFVLILYLEKPIRMSVIVENTVFGALLEN